MLGREEDQAAETVGGNGGEADVREGIEDGVEGGDEERARGTEGARRGGEEDGEG